jgi:hypothetical protein
MVHGLIPLCGPRLSAAEAQYWMSSHSRSQCLKIALRGGEEVEEVVT